MKLPLSPLILVAVLTKPPWFSDDYIPLLNFLKCPNPQLVSHSALPAMLSRSLQSFKPLQSLATGKASFFLLFNIFFFFANFPHLSFWGFLQFSFLFCCHRSLAAIVATRFRFFLILLLFCHRPPYAASARRRSPQVRLPSS